MSVRKAHEHECLRFKFQRCTSQIVTKARRAHAEAASNVVKIVYCVVNR